MKARLYCYVPVNADGTLMGICRDAILTESDEITTYWFNNYLLSALSTDFPFYCADGLQKTLQDIEKMQRGETETAYWAGDSFCHSIGKGKVTFEHTIFGECPEWPIWTCTLAQYKAALQGWQRFLQMPVSEESEVIVDMPEGGPV